MTTVYVTRTATYCRFTAELRFQSGHVETVTEELPVRFAEVFEVAGEAIEDACFEHARATTGDDEVINVSLRIHSLETECVE